MRRGFSLLELLFAIIVVSIAMLALPTMFHIVSASSDEIVKDEATFQGFQTAGVILTYRWDENSLDPDTNRSFILDTNGDTELNRVAGTVFRRGNMRLGQRRRFFDTATTPATPLGLDEASIALADDIDDFNGAGENITSNILDLTIGTAVTYVSDTADYSRKTVTFSFGGAAPATTTNLKMVTVRVIRQDDNTPVLVYAAFAANIGDTPILTRDLR